MCHIIEIHVMDNISWFKNQPSCHVLKFENYWFANSSLSMPDGTCLRFALGSRQITYTTLTKMAASRILSVLWMWPASCNIRSVTYKWGWESGW